MAVAGRRLTARSVVLSTLLGTRPPRLPVSRLVRAGDLFGIEEGAVRTALSRLVAAGELVRHDEAWYGLAGRHVERLHRQRSGVEPHRRRWDGGWVQVVVTADRRDAATRAGFRDRMRTARLAELREGIWLRPDNLDVGVRDDDVRVMRWGAADDPAGLASGLWPLTDRAARTAELCRRLDEQRDRLGSGRRDPLRTGFELSADVLRHLADDPLLPEGLDPAGGAVDDLRARYRTFDVEFAEHLRRWLAGTSGRH